ncbi:MAG: PEP-CTERM sorting domain-containing protein [Desulfobacterales bacterium]|nr:PEP-CTERM sorting domain-containing protein [Desulfobacterales bacterium]
MKRNVVMRTLVILVVSVLMGMGSLVWASPLVVDVTGATEGSIPGGTQVNDLLGRGISADGWYGANLALEQDALVTFEFIGEEAGWNNYFEADADNDDSWSTLFTNNGSDWGSSYSTIFDADAFNFRFAARAGGNGYAYNGSNPNDAGDQTNEPNFFITEFTQSIALGESSWLDTDTLEAGIYLWFDDGGAGQDDNHDDMLIRVSAQTVPEPGTMALFGLGLVGLAGISRRKK